MIEILGCDGEEDVNYMNSKINYTDELIEVGQVVKDFLPPSEQLVPKGKIKTNQVVLFHSPRH